MQSSLYVFESMLLFVILMILIDQFKIGNVIYLPLADSHRGDSVDRGDLVKWEFLLWLSDGMRGGRRSTGTSIVVVLQPITSFFSDLNRCERVIPQ